MMKYFIVLFITPILSFAQLPTEFEKGLESYSQDYTPVRPNFLKYIGKSESTDNLACAKELAELRKHKYKVFAASTGASVGILLGLKALIDKQLPQDIKKFNSIDVLIEKNVNRIGAANENAVEIATKIKKYDADNKIFQKGFAELEKWIMTLDPKTPGYQDLSQKMNFLSAKLEMNHKAVADIERLGIELRAAKPEKSAAIRNELVEKSSKHIRQAKIISAEFSDFVSGKIMNVAFHSYKSAAARASSGKIKAANFVSNSQKIASGAGHLATGIVEGSVMGVAVEGVYDMTKGATLEQAEFQNILKERTEKEDFQYCSTVLSFDDSKELFKKNMTLLKTASYIDNGRATKLGHTSAGVKDINNSGGGAR